MGVKAVLLAGGRSFRMGRDKPLLEIGGETLVERHVRQLRAIGVREMVIVCNRENERAIRDRMSLRTVLQSLPGMSGAVLAGLEHAVDFDAAFLVCVNDLIFDEDYVTLWRSTADLAIATSTLNRTFHGGMLELAGNEVRIIVEKPAGGCPPGSAANIMIHRLRGGAITRTLCERLRCGEEYEAAITDMIARGLQAVAVPVRFWLAIKTPQDYSEAQQRLNRNRGAVPGTE